ncbi:unnamed protein product, partial [Didymodactylos carnosus]
GAKIWECSHDLTLFIDDNYERWIENGYRTVLEVGCGHALPAIQLIKHNFDVDLQDFNREVLEQITLNNVKKAVNEKYSYNNRLFFGDWTDLLEFIPSKHYDIIITSETIYSITSYKKLIDLFDHTLTYNGVIYVAAKVHYFGVEGNINLFKDFVLKTKRFDVAVEKTIDANVKRQLLRITRQTSTSVEY